MRLKKMVMPHSNNTCELQTREIIPGIFCDALQRISVRGTDNDIHVIITPEKNAPTTLYCLFLNITKKYTLEINFQHPYSECHIIGLYQLNAQHHLDIKTIMNHHVPHCTSKQVWKGVLHDSAKAAFDGKIVVHPKAQKTAAFLSNKNLLLSSKAEVNTKPALEIYADDVTCSHGATIGCLEKNAIFYLRSRGISENKARELLVAAFVEEVRSLMPAEINHAT